MSLETILSDIASAAGFQIGQTYSAEEVVHRLREQGRNDAADASQYNQSKIAELFGERFKLHTAMMEARSQLMALSMATEGAVREQICRASNVLSKALGVSESSHGREPDEDFEAQRRLAEQAMERD